MLLSSLRANPILRAEVHYQQHHHTKQRPGWRGRLSRAIMRLVRLTALGVAVLVVALEVTALLLGRDTSQIAQASERLAFVLVYALPLAVLLPYALVLHLHLLLRTIFASADAVAREHRHNTWDLLALSPSDTNHIILGKWWATLLRLRGDLAVLLVLRIGLVTWIGLLAHRVQFYQWYGQGGSTPQWVFAFEPHVYPPDLTRLPLAWLIASALLLVNLGFTAALGLWLSTLLRRVSLSAGLTIALRIGLLVGLALLLYWSTISLFPPNNALDAAAFYRSPAYVGLMVGGSTAVTLVDNGTTVSSMIARSDPDIIRLGPGQLIENTYRVNYYVTAAVLTLTVYGLVGWGCLLAARRRIVRDGVLRR